MVAVPGPLGDVSGSTPTGAGLPIGGSVEVESAELPGSYRPLPYSADESHLRLRQSSTHKEGP